MPIMATDKVDASDDMSPFAITFHCNDISIITIAEKISRGVQDSNDMRQHQARPIALSGPILHP
jgi:hypothetical protein